eukprot:s3478_g6.t2
MGGLLGPALGCRLATYRSYGASWAQLWAAVGVEKLELCQTEWQELDKRLVERFDTRLDKQGRVCKELNEKQLELQKLLQQAKSSGDRANATTPLGKMQQISENHLSLSLEALKEGLETSSRGHQATAHELREELEGLKEELQQRSKAWADTNREVHHLQTWAEELRQLQQLTEKQDVAQAELQAQQQRLAQLEQRLSDILLRPDHEGSALRDELELVQKQLEQFSAEVLKGKEQQRAHVDLLSSASNRLHDLEGELPRLHEQLNACKGEVEDLSTWRADSSQALQGTQRSLFRAESQLGEMQGRVKELGTGYEEVRQEQGSTRESLTKMSARLDLCNKYFSGLGKGLKDAHNQIVGCEGVLPKMGEHGLPPLMPRTPRTPRQNSLPSPRRPQHPTLPETCCLCLRRKGREHEKSCGCGPSTEFPAMLPQGSLGFPIFGGLSNKTKTTDVHQQKSKLRLQLAQCFSFGQAVQWICSIGGGLIGYFATFEDAHRWRRQDTHSDSDDDDPFMQGVDSEAIEGHTVGHTFHGARDAQAGNPEHLKCMVCMEEFADGETLRSLPCLHRYHQNCIDQWLVRCAACPICKQNITAPQNVSSRSVVDNTSTSGFARFFSMMLVTQRDSRHKRVLSKAVMNAGQCHHSSISRGRPPPKSEWSKVSNAKMHRSNIAMWQRLNSRFLGAWQPQGKSCQRYVWQRKICTLQYSRLPAPRLRPRFPVRSQGRRFGATPSASSKSQVVRPPWHRWEEHWSPVKVEEGLRSGEVLIGRLHVPSFQTDTAFVVTKVNEEDVWIPVTGFAGATGNLLQLGDDKGGIWM